MKTFLKMASAFIAFGLIADAHANEWWYVNTPARLTAEAPNAVPCQVVNEGGLYLDCRVEGLPSQEAVLYRTDQRNGILTKTEANNTIATHQGNGIYQDSVNGYFVGRLPTGKDYWGRVNNSLIRITRDYYLHPDPETNKAFAYRYGTGPMADDFALPRIDNDHDAFYHDSNTPEVQYVPEEAILLPVDVEPEPHVLPPEGMWQVYREGNTYTVENSDGERVETTFEELPHHIPLNEPDAPCLESVLRRYCMAVVDDKPFVVSLRRDAFRDTEYYQNLIVREAEVKDGYYSAFCYMASDRNCRVDLINGESIEVSRSELPEYLPMASGDYDCDNSPGYGPNDVRPEPLCYGKGQRGISSRVVGLNPDYDF